MKQHLKRLRDQLPHRYISILSTRLKTISNRQVRAVFNGGITNPQIVDKVLAAAVKLRKETETRNKTLLRKIKPARTRRSSKRAA